MNETKFRQGDVVVLKSEAFEKTPIKMTVESINGNTARCLWVGIGDNRRRYIMKMYIDCNILQLVSKGDPDADISVGDCVVLQSAGAGTSTIVMNVEKICDYTCTCIYVDKYDNSVHSDYIEIFALKKRTFEISV